MLVGCCNLAMQRSLPGSGKNNVEIRAVEGALEGGVINGNMFRILALLSLFVGIFFMSGVAGAVTVPTSITSYLPITIQNAQTYAFPSNAQVPISFNALAYQSYESNSLNNTEFFFANGTIIPSWLEGNTLNENNAANTLYKSANVLFWLRIYPSNSFFCASCSNTIYLGFASKTTSMLSSTITGEAPQLSSSYGAYDDGANVFALYDDFTGTALNARWTEWDSSAGTLAVSNSLSLTATSTSHAFGVYVSYTPTTNGIVTETYLTATNPTAGYRLFEGYGTLSSSTAEQNGYIGRLDGNGNQALYLSRMSAGVQADISNTPDVLTTGGNYVSSLLWQGNSNSLSFADLTNGHSLLATNTLYGLPSMAQVSIALGAATSNHYITHWFRIRQALPNNGVVPTETSGVVTLAGLTATPDPYTLTNTSIDVKQISIANTIISGGTSGTTSYTGNWVWSPPASSNIVLSNTIIAAIPTTNNALTLTINAVSSNSLKMTFNGIVYYANAIGTNTIYGTWTFNAFASDANHDAGPSPALTNTLTISATPTISAPTPTSSKVDVGQTQTITATITGGTPNYVGNAIITNSGSITNTIAVPSQSGTSLSSTWTTASNEIGTETGNFVMKDAVSVSFNSIPSTSWTVYNTLSTLTTTGATIDNGQSNTITASWIGGAPNFAVTLFSGSSATCSSDTTVANTAASVSGQSTTFVVSPTSSTYYCIGVKDSATSAVSANQVTAVQIVVNPALSITSVWSSNSIADQSQYETITGSWTGGTSPFTANFYITNTITGNVIANSLTSTTSPATFTFQVPQTNDALGAPLITFTVTDQSG